MPKASGSPEISGRLEESRFELFCLTADNLEAPWLLFEAGAISKSTGSRAFTFLLDVTPGDVRPPLGDFQHTLFERDDVKKLVASMNSELEKPLPGDLLEDAFTKSWPDFEKALNDIKNLKATAPKAVRNDSEKLDELLDTVRVLSRDLQRERLDTRRVLASEAVRELVMRERHPRRPGTLEADVESLLRAGLFEHPGERRAALNVLRNAFRHLPETKPPPEEKPPVEEKPAPERKPPPEAKK